MKTVKIPVKGMSVGELIDSVMAGGEYKVEGRILSWSQEHGVSYKLGEACTVVYSVVDIKKSLDDGKIYKLKPSEEYVAELLNNWRYTTISCSQLQGSKMIVKFLESEGFLTLPEGEV